MAKEIPDIDRLIMPGSEEQLRLLDRLKMFPDLFLKFGLAYTGYKATGHWTGAVAALVALRLAEGNNLAGGAAGVSTLTLLGLGAAFKPTAESRAAAYAYLTDPTKHPPGSTYQGIPLEDYP